MPLLFHIGRHTLVLCRSYVNIQENSDYLPVLIAWYIMDILLDMKRIEPSYTVSWPEAVGDI